MLGIYRVAAQLVSSRVVITSTELVTEMLKDFESIRELLIAQKHA
jgi:hypothetical protein